jgi:uncharacterized protein DUF3105
MLFIGLGAAIVIAAAVVGIAMAVGGGNGGIEASKVCKFQTFPDQGRRHIAKRLPNFEYNSTPPTSGPHYPLPRAPAVWSVYSEPLDQLALIHNLEHGGMVIQYGGLIPPATVQKLVDWYGNDPRGIVIAPLPEELETQKPALKGEIAVTAWTHLMTCGAYDEAALDDFKDSYRGPQGDAPEKFPLDALQPGGQ